ncbi:MAG: DMT family transporter [Paracoccaceae bacterium]
MLMLIATLVFATQDGLSRYLAEKYSVTLTIILRFWALAGGIFLYFFLFKESRSLLLSKRPFLQILRSSILVAEIFVTVYSFTIVGLVTTSAIFSSYPLLVVVFSYFILKEELTKLKLALVFLGFIGVLIIVRPGGEVFQMHSILPLIGAVLFALYGALTRMASFSDSSYTSLIWIGLIGAFFSTFLAPFYLLPIDRSDIFLMLILCILGVIGHFTLIKAFEFAEATVVQPFAYFHLVFAGIIGVSIFNESLTWPIIIGSSIVILAGISSYSLDNITKNLTNQKFKE